MDNRKLKAKPNLTKNWQNYSDQVNRPIITSDALARDIRLPSQKLHKDQSCLGNQIEALLAELFVIDTDIEKAQKHLATAKAYYQKRYSRDPKAALSDPRTYTMAHKLRSLRARKIAYSSLVEQMQNAYIEIAKTEYTPRNKQKRPKNETKKEMESISSEFSESDLQDSPEEWELYPPRCLSGQIKIK